MRPSKAIKGKLDEIRLITESHGFKNPVIFGSTVTGKDTDLSDLDIVVEKTEAVKGMLQLANLALDLEELLGVGVDIKTWDMIPKAWMNDVLEGGVKVR